MSTRRHSMHFSVCPVVNTVKPTVEKNLAPCGWKRRLSTITGGNTPLSAVMAEDALRAAMPALPHPANLLRPKSYFSPLPTRSSPQGMAAETWLYLLGRYGNETIQLFENAEEGENQPVGSLPNLWSEVRWAARCGAVETGRLLLRRVRLGLLMPHGARRKCARARNRQPELLGRRGLAAEFTRYVECIKNLQPSPCWFRWRTNHGKRKKTQTPIWYEELVSSLSFTVKVGNPAAFKHPE